MCVHCKVRALSDLEYWIFRGDNSENCIVKEYHTMRHDCNCRSFQGCFGIIQELIEDNSAILIGITAGILVLEVCVLLKRYHYFNLCILSLSQCFRCILLNWHMNSSVFYQADIFVFTLTCIPLRFAGLILAFFRLRFTFVSCRIHTYVRPLCIFALPKDFLV